MKELSDAVAPAPDNERAAGSGIDELLTRNVRIGSHRTSIRLEPTMWAAFDEVVQREGTSPHALCTLIAKDKRFSNLTSAVRVFLLDYFRAATTPLGHRQAGHGRVLAAKQRNAAEARPHRSKATSPPLS